jgi:hypothetical protein
MESGVLGCLAYNRDAGSTTNEIHNYLMSRDPA